MSLLELRFLGWRQQLYCLVVFVPLKAVSNVGVGAIRIDANSDPAAKAVNSEKYSIR